MGVTILFTEILEHDHDIVEQATSIVTEPCPHGCRESVSQGY